MEKVLIPEWEEQSAVLLAWPHPEGDFSPWFRSVENVYLECARAITKREQLIIACRNEAHRASILACLSDGTVSFHRVQCVILPYNDVWVRDTAPLSVLTPEGPCLLNFRFNGWGNKYDCTADAEFAQALHATGMLGPSPLKEVDFVLEGGSIESDGLGTLLTTARCLLHPNRNPGWSISQITQQLETSFGTKRIIWLEQGYAEGDDTDAHVDTLARFCSPDTIAYTACDATDDPNYDSLLAMEEQLKKTTSAAGQPYHLVRLPVPPPIYSNTGQPLPATYANFLIINGAVLVPTYQAPTTDQVALERLGACFPGRDIVPIDSLSLIQQYGSVHCMTMSFPKVLGMDI